MLGILFNKRYYKETPTQVFSCDDDDDDDDDDDELFCGMVDRRKVFSLISSRDHCERSSSSRISDTL